MLYPLIAAIGGIIPSLFLIRAIERSAERLSGARLSRWRRLLIPLPIVLFLAANLDGVLSLISYLHSHPGAVAVRDDGNLAWSTDRFFYAGFLALGFLPFVLAPTPLRGYSLFLVTWGGHTLWMFFPFAPLLLASGVPFQQ
jgi:hypothetical protein